MVTVDLGAQIPPHLQLARANAIQAYANMETSLSLLFAYLLETSPQKAGIVFFRLTNTHSRNSILSSLLELKHGNHFDQFWYGFQGQPGVLTLIRQLDQRRNEIVHWHLVDNIHVEDDGTQTRHQSLAPPNFWWLRRSANTNAVITLTDLVEFSKKADFVHRALIMLWVVHTQSHFTQPERQTWLDIFARPIVYPLPDTHPLSPSYKGRETPPQSSGG